MSNLADEQTSASVNTMMSATARRSDKTGSNYSDPIPPGRAAPVAPSTGNGPAWSPAQGAQLQFLRAKALSASVRAERDRRELSEERGKYMLAAEAEAEWTRVLAAFLLDVEQSVTDLASTLGLTREQTVGLRRWWRNQHAKAAEANRTAAAAQPEFVEDTAA